MFPHEKPDPLGRQNWTPEILRESEGGRDTSEGDISGDLADKWSKRVIVGDKKMEAGKRKRHAPTETAWEWKGNESLISVYVSHVYVSDQSNLFTH